MKLFLLALALVVIALGCDVQKATDKFTECYQSEFTKGACNTRGWCPHCLDVLEELSNCTCTNALSTYGKDCVGVCTEYSTCVAELAYNEKTQEECEVLNEAYQACLTR